MLETASDAVARAPTVTARVDGTPPFPVETLMTACAAESPTFARYSVSSARPLGFDVPSAQYHDDVVSDRAGKPAPGASGCCDASEAPPRSTSAAISSTPTTTIRAIA